MYVGDNFLFLLFYVHRIVVQILIRSTYGCISGTSKKGYLRTVINISASFLDVVWQIERPKIFQNLQILRRKFRVRSSQYLLFSL